MGALADRAQEILEKEKANAEDTKIWIENEFYLERKAITKAFAKSFPQLIPMMEEEGIYWGVLPNSYDADGLSRYFAPDFQIQFRPSKPYGKAPDKVCLMDISSMHPNHINLEKRWESFKYRFSTTQIYGHWGVDKIIVTLYQELISES